MKKAIIYFILPILIFACADSGQKNTTTNPPGVSHEIDTSYSATDRPQLIRALTKLSATFASNNKEQIAGIFQFPLPDTAFTIFPDDTTYYDQLKRNGGKITTDMFLRYFDQIESLVMIDQVNNLFEHINLDNLLTRDTLEYDGYVKAEPCYYSYKLQVDYKVVILRIDRISNIDYESKTISPDDVAENASEMCEYNFWWIFHFDGKTMRFIKIDAAG